MQNLDQIKDYVAHWALTTLTSEPILTALCIIAYGEYVYANEMHDNPSSKVIETVKMIVTKDGNISPASFNWVNCHTWSDFCFNEEMNYNYY